MMARPRARGDAIGQVARGEASGGVRVVVPQERVYELHGTEHAEEERVAARVGRRATGGSPPRRRRRRSSRRSPRGPTRARGGERRVASSRRPRRRAARERATARVSSPEETRRAGRRRRDARGATRDRAEPARRARARTRAYDRRTRHRRDTRACECPAVVVAGETSRPSATIRSSRRGRDTAVRARISKTTNGGDDSEGLASLPETGVRARARPFISSPSLRQHRLSRALTHARARHRRDPVRARFLG